MGDVVIWRNQSNNGIVHSARVHEVDESGNIVSVIHLAGGNTETEITGIPNVSETFENTQTTVYREREQ